MKANQDHEERQEQEQKQEEMQEEKKERMKAVQAEAPWTCSS